MKKIGLSKSPQIVNNIMLKEYLVVFALLRTFV